MKNHLTLLVLLTALYVASAQQKPSDSLQVNALQEIVVTGQMEPQSLKKSVFNVRVISAKDIQNLAANTLADVLNQYLNITLRPSGTDGRSTVSLFGLDGQYFKILVDNIPLVGESGLGNNADLSQINLDDVQQIEIIEGSMGVTHGANAVSGVLNIITKKAAKTKWNLRATLQEETVQNEYAWIDKGRHIQGLSFSFAPKGGWFFNAAINRNDFQGFLNDKKGKFYFENDGTRGYRWLPKEQLTTSTTLGYQKNQFRFFYKFQFLNEQIDFYNSSVQSAYNPELGAYRYALDQRFLTHRNFHHLSVSGNGADRMNYTVSLSYQKQQRDVESFRYLLYNLTEQDVTSQKDQATEVLYSTGTWSNFFKSQKLDLQLGYEISRNLGFALIQESNNLLVPISKRLNNYDFFVGSELKCTPSFSLRPGFRYSIQSLFENQYAASLGVRYLLKNEVEWRASVGQSFRTPSFEELYVKQIFDGHHFTGNENLIPETSTSFEMSCKKNFTIHNTAQLASTLTGSFLQVKDRIDMALVQYNPTTGNPEYEYININTYKMWNVATTNQFKSNNFGGTFGAALVGIAQQLDNNAFRADDRFLYSFSWNTSLSYTLPQWQTVFSAYYKYNGKTQQFIATSSEYVISDIGESHWLDATVQRKFFNATLETTFGARNILNITNINQTRTADGTGHAASNQIMLAYGRSFFLKVTYNLNL